MEKELIIKQEGDLTRLTLNRPETRNALNATLVEELISAVDEAVCEGSKLLVFSGNGKFEKAMTSCCKHFVAHFVSKILFVAS